MLKSYPKINCFEYTVTPGDAVRMSEYTTGQVVSIVPAAAWQIGIGSTVLVKLAHVRLLMLAQLVAVDGRTVTVGPTDQACMIEPMILQASEIAGLGFVEAVKVAAA